MYLPENCIWRGCSSRAFGPPVYTPKLALVPSVWMGLCAPFTCELKRFVLRMLKISADSRNDCSLGRWIDLANPSSSEK